MIWSGSTRASAGVRDRAGGLFQPQSGELGIAYRHCMRPDDKVEGVLEGCHRTTPIQSMLESRPAPVASRNCSDADLRRGSGSICRAEMPHVARANLDRGEVNNARSGSGALCPACRTREFATYISTRC